MTALLNLQAMLVVLVLSICTCSFLRPSLPRLIDRKAEGFRGVAGKLAVIGDRLSPYVSLACVIMAATTLFCRA